MHLKLLKFLLSGGSAAIVEYITFLVLNVLLTTYWVILSQIVSFLFGFIVSFFLNKTWVFQASGNTKSQLVKYVILAAINLILTSFVIWLLVNKLQIPGWIAKVIVMGMVAIWNYVLFSRIIFSSTKAVHSEDTDRNQTS